MSRYAINFRVARIYIELSADAFAAAKTSLAPFLSHENGDADAYAAAAQAVNGQELTRQQAEEAGLVDEDGRACEGVEIIWAD